MKQPKNPIDAAKGVVKSAKPKTMLDDNRVGRLTNTKTDRGTFRFKANRKGEND